jgi:5S rRNA maturation endonuclease (ribonuclease M5)
MNFKDILNEMKGKTVIVEGRRDVKALHNLGITSIAINGRPLHQVVAQIENKEAVILTDFDKKGRALAARLRTLCEARRIATKPKIRAFFASLGKSAVENIKEGDIYGKTCTKFDKVCNSRYNSGKWCCREIGYNWSNFWSD